MVLAQDEIDACREAFLAFDKDRCVACGLFSCKRVREADGSRASRSGTIDVWELRQVLEGAELVRCVYGCTE